MKKEIGPEVLYEDEDIMAVNKPEGLVVHPSKEKNFSGETVAQIIKKKMKYDDGTDRTGIVHRLDKDTSGILLIAKTEKARDFLINQFKKRKVSKIYLALVCGILEHKEAIIDSPIGRSRTDRKKMAVSRENEGKNAISVYRVLKEFDFDGRFKASLLEVEIKTGRTHQIRVHLKAIGHPIIGDQIYGNRSFNTYFDDKFGLKRQFLHAFKMSFENLEKKKINLRSELPENLEKIIKLS